MSTNGSGTQLTALLITYDEEANIGRVLPWLSWVPRVIVLDSGSNDDTVRIAKRFANVEVHVRPFDSLATQCNHGLSLVDTEWCLSLDADYIVPRVTADELQAAMTRGEHDGYYTELAYCVVGQRLRKAILPKRTVLFRTRKGRYVQDGHAHRLVLDGSTDTLRNPILHDDRKPLRRWLASQETYAGQEAAKLSATSWKSLSWPDRVRRLGVVAPWLVPSYCLFVKGGILDGWPGIDYAAQRAVAELLLSIKLIEEGKLGDQ